MKTYKLVIFNLVAFVLMVNTLFIYLLGGFEAFSFTKEYFKRFSLVIGQMLIVFIVQLFVTLSYIISYAKTRKNLLRISLIILFFLFIFSFARRVIDFTNGYFYISTTLNTVLYLVLIILNIIISRDLYNLLRSLFVKRKKQE